MINTYYPYLKMYVIMDQSKVYLIIDKSKLILSIYKLISDELKMSKKTYELCFDEEGLRIIPIGEDQV